jgi:NAD(P)H dehydrogenase (quinone)
VTLVITGATGKLGALTVDALLRRGVWPGNIVAAGRDSGRLEALAARGVGVARIDFDDPSTLRAAFDGARRVLLVSAPGNPRRTTQHRNAIRAAEDAGVAVVVYTSWVHADTSTMLVAVDHRATERALEGVSTPHAVLRCAGYFEARTAMIPFWRDHGEVLGATGDASVSSVSRFDLADAAAVVLTTDGHDGAIYELASDKPYTLSEFAAELSRQTGDRLPHVDVDVAEFEARLLDAGFARPLAVNLADYDRAAAAGEALVDTGDLKRLVDRPLIELPEAIAQALATQ